ncbi:cytochrome P450 [Xylaria bambusicola]|uniref:cytochrome P450 n=1 Tax=Xylaria bambusicola TaxID=326684 RepID=UPI0020080DD9|nr:cytochrome P450 [Xylaria bambusicola]KAI0505471.1 cytochrome P450 [Xylaria bambusicola]
MAFWLLQLALSSPNISLAIIIALCTFAAWYGLLAFRSWHRLRQFPGPWFASFSYLWGYFAMSTGRMHLRLAEEQDRYGKIMRIGPNELLVYDPQTLCQINNVRSNYDRGAWYNSIQFDPYGHSVLSEPDTAKHDKRKAKLAGGYAGKGAVDLEAKVDSQIAVLVKLLRSKCSGKEKSHNIIDFSRLIRFFQVDIVTLAGSGEPWGNLASETDRFDFISIADSFVPFLHSFMMIPTLRDFFASKFFLKLAGPKHTDQKGMGRFLGIVKEVVSKRFDESVCDRYTQGDMLDEWINNGLTRRECELELAIQVPAGSETSTTAIRGIMLYLLSSPPVYKKLQDEIAVGVAEGRISSPITNEEAKRLPYLQAVINEGLRMVPPAITGFPKKVPAGGDILCGMFVPEGTDIFVNLWAMLRNRAVFGPDADVFRPERFLECTDEKKAELMRSIDLAFGHGRWQCPGKTLAWLELNKIFVEILRACDLQIVNPQTPWRCRGYSSFLIDDFWVRLIEKAT